MRSLTLASLSMAAALPLTFLAAAGDAAAAAPARAASHRTLPSDCPDLLPPDDPALYYCGRQELGPATLPTTGPVSTLLKDYHRLGGLEPTQFLDWYRSGTSWKYPDNRGFAETNGVIDMGKATMQPGWHLDRFGAATGKYLADGGTPYARRALPPDSLNGDGNNYHCYLVNLPFDVQEGHIAAAFAQPGFGQQQWLDPQLKPSELEPSETYNVANLIKRGFLTEDEPEQCTR
ncbi:TNT domain-containing protein [Kitasatospora aureofaciens]|uniref:TNT domain-containing protein n=1 Tax=Kitasatospora aureofaciens TaxID=1894 RepID=UPI0038128D63